MPSPAEATRRYLALARAVLRARRAAYDPFKLTWILTEACSCHCKTCHLWVGDADPGPELATIERVVAANPHLTWLNLSGGDFVERPDAPRILDTVTHGFPDLALLDFPTAGLDTEATLAALEPALDSDVPRIYVTVSLDGPDEVHDRIRGRRGAAQAARRTLRRLQSIRRKGFTAVAGMTLSRHNLPDTPAADPLDLLPEDLPLDALHLNLAHHSEHYYRNSPDVTPPRESALHLLDTVRRGQRVGFGPLALMERRYWTLARQYLERGRIDGSCGALRASVFLGSDLTVHPCTLFDRPLGNLADIGYALRRIPELTEAAGALAEVEAQACPGCWSPCEAFPTLLVGLGRPL